MKVEVEIEQMARALAGDDDNRQSRFLNVFAEELFIVCGDSLRLEKQCCDISRRIGLRGAQVIAHLAAFIKLRVDEQEGEG